MFTIIEVKKLVVSLIKYIQEDYKNSVKEEESFLYKLLFGKKEGNFDFYEQSKSIFLRESTSPNNIQISLEYPKDKTRLPAYIIREPSRDRGDSNSIGKIFGYNPEGGLDIRDSRRCTFEIMCFSTNMLESIILSEVLYALFIGSYNELSVQFTNIDFRMRELMMNQELIPTPIFIRSLEMDISYEEFIPSLFKQELLGKIIFEDAGLEATFLSNGEKLEGLPGVSSKIN